MFDYYCRAIAGRVIRLRATTLEEELQVSKEGHDEPHMAFAEAEIELCTWNRKSIRSRYSSTMRVIRLTRTWPAVESGLQPTEPRQGLTRLGRFDERARLCRKHSDRDEKGYKQLLPDIELSQAQLLLAERSRHKRGPPRKKQLLEPDRNTRK